MPTISFVSRSAAARRSADSASASPGLLSGFYGHWRVLISARSARPFEAVLELPRTRLEAVKLPDSRRLSGARNPTRTRFRRFDFFGANFNKSWLIKAPRTLESDLTLRANSLEAHSQLRIEIRQLAGLGARFRPKSNKLPS
jgi:hypothetical protein